MVNAEPRPVVDEVPPARPEPAFLPERPQPWELLSILVGLPGAVGTALALTALAMRSTHAAGLWVAVGAVGILGGYLATMAVVWLGVAAEGRAARRG